MLIKCYIYYNYMVKRPMHTFHVDESCRSKLKDMVVNKISERALLEGIYHCGPKVTEKKLLSYVDETITRAIDVLFRIEPETREATTDSRAFKGKLLEILCKLERNQSDLAAASGLHRVTIYRLKYDDVSRTAFKKICTGLKALGASESDIRELQRLTLFVAETG